MNKENILDYSDKESVESEAKSHQSFYDDNSVMEIWLIERHIQALENSKKNTEFCTICCAELKSTIHAKTHYNSARHIKNIEQLREKLLQPGALQQKTTLNSSKVSNPVLPDAEVRFYCKICHIDVVGKHIVDNHHNDEKHRRNLEAYCDICQERTTSKEALSEHMRFSSHTLKLQQLRNQDGLSMPQAYISSKVSPKTSPKIENIETILRHETPQLQQYGAWNCDVCHKMFETERLFSSHKVVFPHIALETLKIQFTPEIVDAFCSIIDNSILCSLCNIKMQSSNDIKSHLNGVKHVKRFKTKFKEENLVNSELNKTEAEIMITDNLITNKEHEINNREEENGEGEIKAKQENDTGCNVFYCYICKMGFNSKLEVSAHALSFPHAELAKLKSETVALGAPYAEYWIFSDNYFCCTLCNTKFFTTNVPKQHFKTAQHQELLVKWCKEFSTWKCGAVVDPKYFYCKTCCLPLVGTSEAELHYKTKPHLRRVGYYCEICNVANSTKEKFQEHNKSFIHQENAFKEKEDPINPKTSENGNVTSDENPSGSNFNLTEDKNLLKPDLNIPLKEQVFIELQRLIETLYYSNSLPYDVALDYLKKVNKDIKELKQKYGKDENNQKGPESDGKYATLDYRSCNGSFGAGASNEYFREVDVEEQKINDEKKVAFDDVVIVPDSLNSGSTIVENVLSETDFNNKKPPKTNDFPEKKRRKKKHAWENVQDTGKGILKITTEEEANRRGIENEEENGITGKENETVLKNSANFEEMLQTIILRRNEVDTVPGKYSVEKEVLDEVETLIKLVEKGDIPLNVTLGYLQDCNRTVKEIVDKNKHSVKFNLK